MKSPEERATIRAGIGEILVEAKNKHPNHKGKMVSSARADELLREAATKPVDLGKATGSNLETAPPRAVESDSGSASLPMISKPPVAAPVIIPDVPAVIGAKRWKVVKTCKVSLFGQTMTLPAGKIIGEDSHSSEALNRIREQGVELEAVI